MAIPPTVGDPAPRFVVESEVNPRFDVETIAGRYIVLGFVGSAGAGHAGAAMAQVAAHRALFDDRKIALFWVSCDPADRTERRLKDDLPGVHVFWDLDAAVSRQWGLVPNPANYTPSWFVLDPQLRVLMTGSMLVHTGQLMEALARLPDPERHSGTLSPAPVLVLPRVFEPDFCRTLIEAFRAGQAQESGFMVEEGGKTVLAHDHDHKRRRDVYIEDAALLAAARGRVHDRLVPEIHRCFAFRATRIERYLIARYGAEEGGFFTAHRDNINPGTAHRRFAVTINLNAEDYEGGDLTFPEFGTRPWRAPTGGAVVFSCSLLHEVQPMIRGERFAFLPFLYDEAAAAIQEANRASML